MSVKASGEILMDAGTTEGVDAVIDVTRPICECDQGHIAVGWDVVIKITGKSINSDRGVNASDGWEVEAM